MGMYATLESASVACPACGNACTGDWQFYFGSVSELPRYRLGDQIIWSGSEWFVVRSSIDGARACARLRRH